MALSSKQLRYLFATVYGNGTGKRKGSKFRAPKRRPKAFTTPKAKIPKIIKRKILRGRI